MKSKSIDEHCNKPGKPFIHISNEKLLDKLLQVVFEIRANTSKMTPLQKRELVAYAKSIIESTKL